MRAFRSACQSHARVGAAAVGGLIIALLVLHTASADVSVDDARRAASTFLAEDAGQWRLKYTLPTAYALEDPAATREIQVDRKRGSIYAYNTYAPPKRADHTPAMPREKAEGIALQYAARAGLQVDARALRLRDYKADDAKPAYGLNYTLFEDDVALPICVSIEVEAISGRLLDYLAIDFLPLKISLKPAVSREKATSIALKAATGLNGAKVTETHLYVWPEFWSSDLSSNAPRKQALLWRVVIVGVVQKATPEVPAGIEVSVECTIDAATGDVRMCISPGPTAEGEGQIEAARPVSPAARVLTDYAPTWADDDTLYFGTTRHTNDPATKRQASDRVSSVFRLHLGTGRMECVIADGLSWAPSFPAVDLKRGLLACNERHAMIVVDLATGRCKYWGGMDDDAGVRPVWGKSGDCLFASLDLSDSPSVSRVAFDARTLTQAGYSRVSGIAQGALGLILSPDGRRLVYTERKSAENHGELHAVRLVRLDERGKRVGDVVRLTDWRPFARGLGFAPDSGSVFVLDGNQLERVNVATRAKSVTVFPQLHDPDLPTGKPLTLSDARLSPDGDTLVFSSERWSGRASDSAGDYIYACRRDGSGLRRVTPLEDTPVDPCVFAASGKTALDLGAEIAAHWVIKR